MRNSETTIERNKQRYSDDQQHFIEEAERAAQFDLGEHETLRYLGYTNQRTLENRLWRVGRSDLYRRLFPRP